MGYNLFLNYYFNRSVTFNSLYGIKMVMLLRQLLFYHFQFPLWDTPRRRGSTRVDLAKVFQFPLWDTIDMTTSKLNKENNFQFPLWDTK